MRHKLTKRYIDGLSPPERGEYVVWDTDLKRFGLRVKASGSKSFLIQYRNSYGRSRRKSLGSYPPTPPEQARRTAQMELGRVTLGADPAQERHEALGVLTVRDASEKYLAEYVEVYSKSRTYAEARRSFAKYINPALGHLSIKEVTRQDLASLHRKLRKTPSLANRVIRVASGFFSFCLAEGILTPDAAHPARGITPYKERRRERFLSIEELNAMGDAILSLEQSGELSRLQCDAVRLVLLTGCRVGEVLNLTWHEVSLDQGSLFLKRSKTGQKVVVLGTAGTEILSRVPKISGYVFPSPRKKDAPYTTLRGVWKKVCEEAGVDNVRVHDLRHTMASIGAQLGLSLQVIGRILGHSQVSTTARYAHLADDPVRQAVERIQGTIVAALNGNRSAQVIPLRPSSKP